MEAPIESRLGVLEVGRPAAKPATKRPAEVQLDGRVRTQFPGGIGAVSNARGAAIEGPGREFQGADG